MQNTGCESMPYPSIIPIGHSRSIQLLLVSGEARSLRVDRLNRTIILWTNILKVFWSWGRFHRQASFYSPYLDQIQVGSSVLFPEVRP